MMFLSRMVVRYFIRKNTGLLGNFRIRNCDPVTQPGHSSKRTPWAKGNSRP